MCIFVNFNAFSQDLSFNAAAPEMTLACKPALSKQTYRKQRSSQPVQISEVQLLSKGVARLWTSRSHGDSVMRASHSMKAMMTRHVKSAPRVVKVALLETAYQRGANKHLIAHLRVRRESVECGAESNRCRHAVRSRRRPVGMIMKQTF